MKSFLVGGFSLELFVLVVLMIDCVAEPMPIKVFMFARFIASIMNNTPSTRDTVCCISIVTATKHHVIQRKNRLP